MRRIVSGASPWPSRGNMTDSPSQRLTLTEKERKIATPPKRGNGARWICLPSGGVETQPLRVAMSRTSRVATNEPASENANNAKNRNGKSVFPSAWRFWCVKSQRATRTLELPTDARFGQTFVQSNNQADFYALVVSMGQMVVTDRKHAWAKSVF